MYDSLTYIKVYIRFEADPYNISFAEFDKLTDSSKSDSVVFTRFKSTSGDSIFFRMIDITSFLVSTPEGRMRDLEIEKEYNEGFKEARRIVGLKNEDQDDEPWRS